MRIVHSLNRNYDRLGSKMDKSVTACMATVGITMPRHIVFHEF